MTIEEYIEAFKEMPEPVAKQLWVRDYLNMITHTRGDNRTEIIRKRRPNEPQEVNDYRIDNYRPVTYPMFNQGITNIQRTVSHSAVEVNFPEDLRDYLEDNNFDDKNLLEVFQGPGVQHVVEMANGRCVTWPVNVGDVTREVDFKIYFVNPRDIIHRIPGEVFTWLSDEKSVVTFQNKEQKIGDVYYSILPDGLWKRIQTGKKTENKFFWEFYYPNTTEIVYDLILGGDLTSYTIDPSKQNPLKYDKGTKNEIEVPYLTSYFAKALPFADELLGEFSDNQGVRVRTNFPLRQLEQVDCGECVNGWINEPGGRRTRCGKCTGGKVSVGISPYGDIVRPERKEGINGDIDRTDYDMVKFLSPAVDILEHGWKVAGDLADRTKDSLNMKYVEEAQSGVAKQADREDKEANLNKIVKQIYSLIRNTVQIMHKFRFPDRDWPVVQINFPESFIPKTIEDLTAEVDTLKKQGAPMVLIGEKSRELTYRTFSGDPYRLKIYDITALVDPYFLLSTEEKARLQSLGAIELSALQTSALAPMIVSQYARDTPGFMDMTNESIIAAVKAQIQSVLSSGLPSPR